MRRIALASCKITFFFTIALLAGVAAQAQQKQSPSPSPSPSPTPQPQQWADCAGEGDTCRFPQGAYVVRFGVSGQYNYVEVAGTSISCNRAVFGDPAEGTGKGCAFLPLVQTPISSALPCSEGQTCIPNAVGRGVVLIEYAADNGSYIMRPIQNGPFTCSNSFFRFDPAEGSAKHCRMRGTGLIFNEGTQVYVNCASEGQSCKVPPTSLVTLTRFGATGNYSQGYDIGYAYVLANVGRINCNIGHFGRDPYEGAGKFCWYSNLPADVYSLPPLLPSRAVR